MAFTAAVDCGSKDIRSPFGAVYLACDQRENNASLTVGAGCVLLISVRAPAYLCTIPADETARHQADSTCRLATTHPSQPSLSYSALHHPHEQPNSHGEVGSNTCYNNNTKNKMILCVRTSFSKTRVSVISVDACCMPTENLLASSTENGRNVVGLDTRRAGVTLPPLGTTPAPLRTQRSSILVRRFKMLNACSGLEQKPRMASVCMTG